MERYPNLSGRSGIAFFELGTDSITVQFRDGATYLYNHDSAGAPHINQMKQLARAGSGLNSYIDRYVYKNYAARLR